MGTRAIVKAGGLEHKAAEGTVAAAAGTERGLRRRSISAEMDGFSTCKLGERTTGSDSQWVMPPLKELCMHLPRLLMS